VDYDHYNPVLIGLLFGELRHNVPTQTIHKVLSQRPGTFLDLATAMALITAVKSMSRRMSDSMLMIARLSLS